MTEELGKFAKKKKKASMQLFYLYFF